MSHGEPDLLEQATAELQQTFGYTEFKLEQKAVMKRLLMDNASALVSFPTGGGKSLCYQIPGMLFDGLTIVISPLISLMKDQVDVLRRKGVKAASLDSSLPREELEAVKRGIRERDLKILYVAPERSVHMAEGNYFTDKLNNESFGRLLSGIPISLLAVDEAHCVSEWGPSFRPEYLKVARFAKEVNAERVLALTATATASVVDDICKGFDIDPDAGVFKTSVYRENLHLSVVVAKTMQDKLKDLAPKLRARSGPAIVYVTLQQQAKTAVEDLSAMGVSGIKMYHAGMSADDRKEVQDWFMNGDKGVVCATIAFAMGIDKNNVRQIHHLMLPKSVESWSQEVGRAGRDGRVSECCMYLCPTDVPVLEGFARGDACSKLVLTNFLNTVFGATVSEDNTYDFSLWHMSKDYDIRPNMLNLLFALLELEYGLLRAVTPYYEVFALSEKQPGGLEKCKQDTSDVGRLINQYWKKGPINVVDLASKAGRRREDISKCISSWELSGWVNSKPSQTRNRYLLLKPRKDMPSTPKEIEEIAVKLSSTMEDREKKELARMDQVIDVATGEECFAFAIAKYFGDGDSVPNEMCNHCTYCKNLEPIEFEKEYRRDPPRGLIEAVLSACPVRDDSRVLARCAFGISTPRLTALGLGRSDVFGSLGDFAFDSLLEIFEAECSKVYYKNQATPTTSGTKRPYGGSGSGARKKR